MAVAPKTEVNQMYVLTRWNIIIIMNKKISSDNKK